MVAATNLFVVLEQGHWIKNRTEMSKVDCVLFQAATAIMEAVVWEWILLEKGSSESLWTLLLTCVYRGPISKSVQERIPLAVAVAVKGGSLDTSADCRNIFHEVDK